MASVVQVIGAAVLMIELYRYLLRELGPEQLGIWSLVVASTAAARLGEMGVGNAVMKFVAGDLGAKQPDRAAATLGVCLSAVACIVAVLCAVTWPLMHQGLSIVITNPALLAPARELLPWALASLWVGSLGQVTLSALDAMQRTDLKVIVTLAAGGAQLVAAYVSVPRLGLQSLGPVQLLHATVLTVLAAIIVATALNRPLRAWLAWPRARVVETLRYGLGVQAGAIGQLLFEPATKALLAVFGGPALTAYFELANRAVTQCRAVIVAGYQTLIPYLAHRAGDKAPSAAEVTTAYLAAHQLLFVLSVPYFALVTASLPLVLTLWLGKYDPTFVWIGLVCAMGWGMNSLTVSAYMIYMAIGRLRWTLWAQVAIGFLNVILASAGGWLAGAMGVTVGSMLGLALGSVVVTMAFHREFGLSWQCFLPADSLTLVVAALLGPAAIVMAQLVHGDPVHMAGYTGVALAVASATCAWLAWRHPAVSRIVTRLRAPATLA